MNKTTFDLNMKKMETFFGKNLKSFESYWDELSHIPDEAFPDICKDRIRSYAPTPGNFPTIQILNDAYQGPGGWLDRHPEKKAKPVREWCPYCESDAPGTIEVLIKDTRVKYRTGPAYRDTIVRCGHCRNGMERNTTWPRLRREEIEARGWVIVTPVRPETDKGDTGVNPYPGRTTEVRSPGMKHIGQSLPVGDRDEEIPF